MLKSQNTYCYAKMVAEKTAMEEASKRGIQLLVVVPAFTIGEMLQPVLNDSVLVVARYLNLEGAKKAYRNKVVGYVDVQDVARVHVLVYEDPGSDGRYLCMDDVLHQSEAFQTLRTLFPQYPVPTK
jgi:cinnamoyl-CoA reductase